MSKPPLGARKEGAWYAIGKEPSITKTPIGPVQVPVPYQVISDLSQATATAETIKLNGEPAYLLDQSKMPKCMGDEQGSSGGARSGTTSMEVKPVTGSGSVKMEGKAIVRAGDKCTLNKENCKGVFVKAPPPAQDLSGSKDVRITIRPSKDMACPRKSIAIQAIVTPAGTPFQWAVSHPFELVDSAGNPLAGASDTAYLQIQKKEPDQAAESSSGIQAEVSVSAPGASGKVESSISLPLHSRLAFGVKWDHRPTSPDERVLGTMERPAGAGYSVAASHETLKTGEFFSGPMSNDSKLQLIVNVAKEGADIVTAMKEKCAEMPRYAAKIRKEFTEFGEALKLIVSAGVDSYESMELVFRLAMGYIAFYFSGDSSGLVADELERWQTDQIKESPCAFDFGKETLSLVTVSGMAWKYDTTLAMEQSCHYSFNINKSIRIRNYTSRLANIGGDLVQSSFSEVYGAIDPHAVAAGVAMSEGILKNGKVYVVAHSQGSEICRAGLEFIQIMGKVSAPHREMIFKTDLVNRVAKTIFCVAKIAFPDGTYRAPKIFDQPLMGVEIAPAKIIHVGDSMGAILKKIHYQGFGSETFIDKHIYELASAQNFRTHGDPIPAFGRTAKNLLALLKFPWKVVLGEPATILSVVSAMSAAKKAQRVASEKWVVVESPVKWRKWLCCFDFNTHDWFKNYWPNLLVPTGGPGPGNEIPTQHPKITQQQLDQFADARSPSEILPKVRPGASIAGKGAGLPMAAGSAKLEQNAAVAIFIDGMGNSEMSFSNLIRIQKETLEHFELPDSKNKILMRQKYVDLPLPMLWDPEGILTGNLCKSKLDDSYKALVRLFIDVRRVSGNYPQHIDLYGFGRGAIVASELAWKLQLIGLPEVHAAFEGSNIVKVRFLGLFDAVHSMVMPENIPAGRREDDLSPNVAYCAQALAGKERRLYFPPCILKARAGKKMSLKVFPGNHDDIGGHRTPARNNTITKMALNWMLREAKSAKVEYLEPLIATVSQEVSGAVDPEPGQMDFPDGIFDVDPLSPTFMPQSSRIPARVQKLLRSTVDLPRESAPSETNFQAAITEAINEKFRQRAFLSPGYEPPRPKLFQKQPYDLFGKRVFEHDAR